MAWCVLVSTVLRMTDENVEPTDVKVKLYLQELLETRQLSGIDFTIELKEPLEKEVPGGKG